LDFDFAGCATVEALLSPTAAPATDMISALAIAIITFLRNCDIDPSVR
jgi:hypothetical protein